MSVTIRVYLQLFEIKLIPVGGYMTANPKKKKKKQKEYDSESFLEVVVGEFIAPVFESFIMPVILFIPRMVVRMCRFIFD